ncbi:ankyrin repeat and MYND domain-containing protein 2-like [Dendronephthya gigantea]|uniref:ankyrin repeat and MYND domain-containing protein 2-like n=1 Tax=Dendronephthya gigantea TaxID=151771 RepID=UPI00106C99B1|nr:ankyrin repeat and MYND domain-containing protein 2-like [Dendronephthya gigantea]
MAAELNEMVRKQLLENINQGNIEEVRRILDLGQIKVDSLDEDGMTPLMQAAYKGKHEICQLLIDKGANVNCSKHEHKYTPLMFACLSGSLEATKVLLEAGADKTAQNNINRTASQLGAFTGRHECVSLINNFISMADLESYTKVPDNETSPKLDPKLLEPLQKYILNNNLSPVRLVLYLKENMVLVEEYKSVVKILHLKCESSLKDPDKSSEVMSMKLHYLGCVLQHSGRWHLGIQGQNGIDGFLKYLIKGRPSDGFPLGTEDFIRQAIREYSFPETTILRQLVTSIAPVNKGDQPTALTCLTQVINGIQSIQHTNICGTCSQPNAEKRCSACKTVTYCNTICQKLHWFTHKKHCKLATSKDNENKNS